MGERKEGDRGYQPWQAREGEEGGYDGQRPP